MLAMRAHWLVVVTGLSACRMGFEEATEIPMTGRDCGVTAELGSLGQLASPSIKVMNETIMTGKIVQLSASIDSELSLRVQLWDGYGVFAGNAAHEGTFELVGAETSAATCGVCVYLSRHTSGQSSSYTTLIGVAGSVDVAALGATGTDTAALIDGITFAELDTDTSTLIADGCVSSIADASLGGLSKEENEGVSRGGHGGDGAGTGGSGD